MKEKMIKLLEIANEKKMGNLISIDIENYVDKIISLATIISIQNENKLNAFIAYYDNDKSRNTAYLSMLIVSEAYQGLGYGRQLLMISINDVKKQGFENYKLEVRKENKTAIELYLSFDFKITHETNHSYFMTKML